MKFSASLDRTVKIITVCISLLFLFVSLAYVRILTEQPNNLNLWLTMVATILFFIAIALGCYLYAPQSYEVTVDALIIRRKIKDVVVPMTDIKEVRGIAEGEMKGLIRTFGVGGFFGYFGRFYAMGYGTMTFYATQSKNRVLIILRDEKKIVITPDDVSLQTCLVNNFGNS